MGLTSSLNIGATALGASQIALQVVGNNLANASTPGYSRQVAQLSPLRPQNYGSFSVGTGVKVADVRRQVDDALQQRLWNAISAESGAGQGSDALGQLEAMLDELGDRSLSNQLRDFWRSWSERANLTKTSAVVVQQAASLTDFVTKLRSDIAGQNDSSDRALGATVGKADQILGQIADLNTQISDFEAGGGEASSLRDQRDVLISELASFMEVIAIEQPSGAMDILVGSTPVVLAGVSRGLQVTRETRGTPPDAVTETFISTKDDSSRLCVEGGKLGGLLAGSQDGTIGDLVRTLDDVIQELVFQVNQLHATGSNRPAFSTMSSTLAVPLEDRSRALNDPTNTTLAGLPWKATSGGFIVQVTSPTGAVQSVRIDIDLDGRRADGSIGFEDDTSLDDIVAQLDAVPGLNARVAGDGTLKLDADTGYSFAFADDTSKALAVLGVNSFFTGRDARDIAVRPDLKTNPSRLAVGRVNAAGGFVENGTALAIAQLNSVPSAALGGRSIQDAWTDAVQQVGLKADALKGEAEAAATVRQALEAQRDAISGVSIDEESINMLNYQRVYQGAARFISTVDEMTQTLLSIV